ncbi:unnamed protein product [Hymenolepis diminuta]|uniref:Mediator of RNA polymerase II transcription subunit 14 n=3 Tax=Hymenolepis diminuta TaxID=6216 RepID=A0A0R3SYP9_HYMDI|nr:unnamed protein product [Hymenolepis diminuta]
MSASAVVGNRSRMIRLALVIDLACQKTYTDLMRLVDLLPSKTDLEKKIELARFFSRTRNLFIRLEALTKWANTSSKVDKCEKISNFLEVQSMLLLDTANVLNILHHNHLISARLPPFAMVLAIDIFVNKTYTRLPKAIERPFIPALRITEKDIRSSLVDLNRIIKFRLSISQLPRRFTNILIDKGRVVFTVPHEFKVTLTMLSESLNFPWRVLDIEFLVSDPKRSIEGSLVHPQQIHFLLTRVQSRILDRRFDKKPPLVHLYDMLHAFAMSLQLDVLFEQAKHLLSRRPTDPFNIEDYRPGQLLKVIYWRGLSTCNYEAVMGPDGKMRPSIYSITIHIDPVDSQRPLCVSHYPELNAEDAFKVGNYIQGSCLSIENLLTRAIVVRAECMLNEIRRDIIPLCPGPITLGEVPLSLCIPILWPCLPHEYLHLRVDSTQGLIRASFPASDQQKCTPLLKDLEVAFNRPTARRVTLDRSSSIECRAGNRGMRNLAADDKRWQVRLGEIFSHLRCLLGQWRIKWSSRGRIVKDCLPISIPIQKMGCYPPRHAGYLQVLERVKQEHSLLSYIKLFPNDEYYLLCEISPTVEGVLSVLYRYFLLKCTPLPTTVTDLRVAPEGRSLLHVSDDVVPDKDSQMVGVALQISHFFPLVGDSTDVLAGKLPSFSSLQFENKLNDLRRDVARTQCTASAKRMNRIRRLLDHLATTSEDEAAAAKRRRILLERFPSYAEASSQKPSGSLSNSVEMKETSQLEQIHMPDIFRLLASIEDDVVVNELNEQLSEQGIQHEGVVNDPLSGILTVDIKSISTIRLPIWAQSGAELLYHYANRVVLISSARSTSSMKQSSSASLAAFSSGASMRCWRLCISFKGLPANHDLLYQSPETPVNSLRDLTNFLHSVVTQWEGLCRLFTICAPVLDNSSCLPPGIAVQLFDAKSLILAYGPGLHYLVSLKFKKSFVELINLYTFTLSSY